MAKQLFGNNASSLLAASISDADLTIQVAGGYGALFPNPGADEYFLVTLENDNGDIEVVKVTSRSTDLLTVPPAGRGQEGTSAQAWTSGQARVELRLTRGTMEVFLQRGGDAMSGDLDMDGNDVVDAVLSGPNTKITAGEIVAVPLRGATGDASNEIAVPSDGSRATAGGQPILTDANVEQIVEAAFVVGQVIMWYGAEVDIPDGWALCNGTNGTPDLRNRFIVGAGDDYPLSATGGALQAGAGTTGAAGGHDHDGVTGDTALNEDQIPEHGHRIYTVNISGAGGDTQGFGASGVGVAGDKQSNRGYRNTTLEGTAIIEPAGGGDGAAHSHTIAAVGDHTHSTPAVDTVPPYYGLFFIMFVGI